uniref:IF factor n=1 Tax=Junco hyemalis TaxID=40217 RepID=A0A8C5NLB7_JUNHY
LSRQRGSAGSRRMLGVALGIGVLLALLGCTDKVSQLLQRMEESVNYEEPANPSVLLAMNLAGGDSDGPIHKWLLEEIKEETVKRAQKDMTSGQVALHVLALLSSCQDPQHVHALEQTLDLISVLQQKTDEETTKLEAEGIPKTTLYSVGLDTLALCLAEADGAQRPSVALAKQLLNPERPISVDTQAMVALALACVYNQVELQDVQDLLWEALQTVSNSFLDEQEERNGMIGNIYSMGLALQVGEVPGECGIAATWHWRPQGSPTWMWLAWTVLPPCPQADSCPCPQCWGHTAFPEVRRSHLESPRTHRFDVPTLCPLRVCQGPTLPSLPAQPSSRCITASPTSSREYNSTTAPQWKSQVAPLCSW